MLVCRPSPFLLLSPSLLFPFSTFLSTPQSRRRSSLSTTIALSHASAHSSSHLPSYPTSTNTSSSTLTSTHASPRPPPGPDWSHAFMSPSARGAVGAVGAVGAREEGRGESGTNGEEGDMSMSIKSLGTLGRRRGLEAEGSRGTDLCRILSLHLTHTLNTLLPRHRASAEADAHRCDALLPLHPSLALGLFGPEHPLRLLCAGVLSSARVEAFILGGLEVVCVCVGCVLSALFLFSSWSVRPSHSPFSLVFPTNTPRPSPQPSSRSPPCASSSTPPCWTQNRPRLALSTSWTRSAPPASR